MSTCEVWCGLEYRDGAVPVDWPGEENSMPFGVTVGSPSDVRAYCTASCRDRASAKASAPTVELAEGWERATPGWRCTGKPCQAVRSWAAYEAHGHLGACEACAPAMGVFASPVTARNPEPVVCVHVGCGRTEPHEHEVLPGAYNAVKAMRSLPQWLVEERALMQSAPPLQVLPEFPRSKIERDNAMFRSRWNRSPRYVGKGRS